MNLNKKKQSSTVWVIVVFVFWLIVNIRVEAGIATSFERALDGIVGGTVLLSAVFLALRFFKCSSNECFDDKQCLKTL